MSASSGFIELVKDVLRDLGPVTVKRMFGGAGVYADGVMFGLIENDALHLKADATTKRAFEDEGQGPFVYQGATKLISIDYWRVPERLYDDPDEMADWARRALAVARDASARKARRVERRTSAPRRKRTPPRRTA